MPSQFPLPSRPIDRPSFATLGESRYVPRYDELGPNGQPPPPPPPAPPPLRRPRKRVQLTPDQELAQKVITNNDLVSTGDFELIRGAAAPEALTALPGVVTTEQWGQPEFVKQLKGRPVAWDVVPMKPEQFKELRLLQRAQKKARKQGTGLSDEQAARLKALEFKHKHALSPDAVKRLWQMRKENISSGRAKPTPMELELMEKEARNRVHGFLSQQKAKAQ